MTRKAVGGDAFRSDINGLRAWAVVAVMLYHFGVPGFSGGFVGVDIFFVISGFLMTSIIVKGLEQGTFSVIGFYMARARRIMPALIFLCAVLLTLGWFILLPPDYKLLSSHSVYALSFLSNIEFWQEAGYFDVGSHEKWLLHTWSLSVEWQFYLVYPLLLWGVWRLKPGRLSQIWACSFGLVSSLAASVYITGSDPSAAFYLLHTRAWEMLSGGLVFLLAGNAKLSTKQRRYIESTGLLMIVLAVIIFNKETAWPGWRAALPVIAAMLILLVNQSSQWTASKLPQWLGDRSYSLYLWHWPVVVALVYLKLLNDPLAIAGGIFLTALLGHFSYVFIENASRRLLEKQRLIYAVAGLTFTTVVVALPAIGVWKHLGVIGRFAPAIELAAAESSNGNPRSDLCTSNEKKPETPSCVYGGTKWKVIVVGDSHANAMITGLAQAGSKEDAGAVQWTYSGCAFVPGIKKVANLLSDKDDKCNEFTNKATTRLQTLPANIPLVIISRYAQAAFGQNEDQQLDERPEVYFQKYTRVRRLNFWLNSLSISPNPHVSWPKSARSTWCGRYQKWGLTCPRPCHGGWLWG